MLRRFDDELGGWMSVSTSASSYCSISSCVMRACSNTDVSAIVVVGSHVAFFSSATMAVRAPLTQDVHTNLAFESSEEVTVAPSFDALGLRDDLLRGIYAYST